MTDDDYCMFLEWDRSDHDFKCFSRDWKAWATAMIESAKLIPHGMQHEDAMLYLFRIMRVFDDLGARMERSKLSEKFVSGLVLSGAPPDLDTSVYFYHALRTAEHRSLVSREDDDWYQPGMPSGSGHVQLYKLTLAGKRHAEEVDPVEWQSPDRADGDEHADDPAERDETSDLPVNSQDQEAPGGNGDPADDTPSRPRNVAEKTENRIKEAIRALSRGSTQAQVAAEADVSEKTVSASKAWGRRFRIWGVSTYLSETRADDPDTLLDIQSFLEANHDILHHKTQARVNRIGADVRPAPSKPKGSGKSKANGRPRIIATYDYRDETGDVLFEVVRYEPKDFRQRRPKPGGGWNWSVKGVRAVPYRLPELLAEPTRASGRPSMRRFCRAGK